MSDSTGLIVISFLGALGFYMNYYAAKMTNDVGAQICTGFVDGAPVPTTQRWLMLYNQWVSYALGGFILTIFFAAAQLLLASYVSDDKVKLLAYLAAIMVSVGSLMWLLQGGVGFFSYRSLLRQAFSRMGTLVGQSVRLLAHRCSCLDSPRGRAWPSKRKSACVRVCISERRCLYRFRAFRHAEPLSDDLDVAPGRRRLTDYNQGLIGSSDSNRIRFRPMHRHGPPLRGQGDTSGRLRRASTHSVCRY